MQVEVCLQPLLFIFSLFYASLCQESCVSAIDLVTWTDVFRNLLLCQTLAMFGLHLELMSLDVCINQNFLLFFQVLQDRRSRSHLFHSKSGESRSTI